MTDKFKDQDSMLPAATSSKTALAKKPAKSGQVIINPPEKVDPQRGFNERFQALRAKHSVVLEKKTELVLQGKASRADFPHEVIEQVYRRGFKALPLNTELTREQYAMNRVNSFIAGGAAMVEDYDLLPITERVHTRIGMKGTGGGARPHIKREKSPYNGKIVYHVVNAKGIVKHSTGDEFEAKKHLATKYNSYMGESTLSPMKRFEGTKSLVKTYKGDTPGQNTVKEGKKDPDEYDQEGEMAKGQLRTIIANAQRAHDMLTDDTNMAEWVQSKITLASDYISTVADYMQSQLKEETLSELNKDTLYSYRRKADKDLDKQGNELDSNVRHGKAKEANKNSFKVSKRMAGIDRAETRLNNESAICTNCLVDPCICEDSHGFVGEARMSASERFSRAFDKQRAKSDASLRRTPSSIPKKEEPKKEVAEGKEDKIAQLKKDHATAVHWSKNETSPQKREAARQKAQKIKNHLETQYKQGVK